MIGPVQVQPLAELPVQLLGQMVDFGIPADQTAGFEPVVVVDQTVDSELALVADQIAGLGILTDQTAGFELVVAVDQTVDSELVLVADQIADLGILTDQTAGFAVDQIAGLGILADQPVVRKDFQSLVELACWIGKAEQSRQYHTAEKPKQLGYSTLE